MLRNFLIFTAISFLLEFYVFQAFKTIFPHSWQRYAYWIVTLSVYLFFIYEIINVNRTDNNQRTIQILAVIFIAFMLPKIIVSVFLLIEDIARTVTYSHSKINHGNYFPERRKFISILGLGTAAVFSAMVLDGVIFGKYRHRIRKVRLILKNLPKEFKGYKIIQISDVHSGSFLHPERLQHAIDLINQQDADLVLFTGDLVNNRSSEFVPFVELFKSIKAKDGKFSVLGNHDYGSYVPWNSPQEKAQNLLNLVSLQEKAGFKVLRNENVAIERQGKQIYILGVENWGLPPFPQFGDLDKALSGIPPEATKILMSHDPTHFDEVVKHHPNPVALTLSGHTHGMQFGVDLKNIRWSPVQYRYKKWADLYESNQRYLYVNRGFGVLGYPGRVGVNPEITLIELA